MLISHLHRFIYTKTVKTAGTSVEVYFEPYCLPPGSPPPPDHEREQFVGPTGVVGRRGAGAMNSEWFNHMPADAIRKRVGEAVWGSYFKFCVVRNPYDKLISAFHMVEAGALKRVSIAKSRPRSWFARLRGRFRPAAEVTETGNAESVVVRFRDWLRSGAFVNDRDKYLICGSECMDHFIRFENLPAGIESVCRRLNLPFKPERLPRLKSEFRKTALPIAAYYDPTTRAIVEDLYGYELQRFGYGFPD